MPLVRIDLRAGKSAEHHATLGDVVYNALRTTDSVSPLAAPAVGSSLIAFVIVYFAVFLAGSIILLKLMAKPPHSGERGPEQGQPIRSSGITPIATAGRLAPGHAATGNT